MVMNLTINHICIYQVSQSQSFRENVLYLALLHESIEPITVN
jgi:hypothetical protein